MYKKKAKYDSLGASTLREAERQKNLIPSVLIDPDTLAADSVPSDEDQHSSQSSASSTTSEWVAPVEENTPVLEVDEIPATPASNLMRPPPQPPTPIPNPDDPSPSSVFAERFEALLAVDVSPTWEEFNSLLDEYIAFSKSHVNIPKESEPV